MAHAYTPGLKVSPRTTHRARRILPISGEVLVNVGDRVSAQDVVARTFMPGNVTPVNLANVLSVPQADVPDCLLKQQGEQVNVGELLARSPGIFGLFKTDYCSKTAGTLETISATTGQIMIRSKPIPVQVLAYLTGTVVEVIPDQGVVIESDVAFIQGIFGIGGEAFGPIRMACRSHTEELTADHITPEMRGAVIVGGARMTGAAVRKAIDIHAAAVVSGGMDDQDLRDILGYDLGVAITGNETLGSTLMITEGFGEIAMAEQTFRLLSERAGDEAAINGATQIRAGVMRPEIVIPLSEKQQAEPSREETAGSSGVLDVGSPVRVIRDPHFGLIGTVTALPAELQTLGSESKARVLDVQFESGENVVVPRANVELIER